MRTRARSCVCGSAPSPFLSAKRIIFFVLVARAEREQYDEQIKGFLQFVFSLIITFLSLFFLHPVIRFWAVGHFAFTSTMPLMPCTDYYYYVLLLFSFYFSLFPARDIQTELKFSHCLRLCDNFQAKCGRYRPLVSIPRRWKFIFVFHVGSMAELLFEAWSKFSLVSSSGELHAKKNTKKKQIWWNETEKLPFRLLSNK